MPIAMFVLFESTHMCSSTSRCAYSCFIYIVYDIAFEVEKQEVGWDSEKPGYEGLIEVANRLMMNGRTNSDTKEAAVILII